MHIDDFDYELPPELIARFPAEKRDASKMMKVNRLTGETEVSDFPDFLTFLEEGDALVLNNTKVIPARIFGTKKDTGGKAEGLLLEELSSDTWKAMLKPGKRLKPGTTVDLPVLGASFDVISINDDGTFNIKFSSSNVLEILEACGEIPLPPYFNRRPTEMDKERYQTVFAEHSGAVAAPTAGLHLTEEHLETLKKRGVKIVYVTLHVGAGTFLPVSVDNINEHKMHSELYTLTEDAAEVLRGVKSSNHKIVAVGTTSVRVLETCYDEKLFVRAGHSATEIFLYPPFESRVADCLLTNFHLPKSTLLMLVSTFTDRSNVMNAYKKAIDEKMRFYSYGDCMFLYK